MDPPLDGVQVEDKGATSILILENVTAFHSGNYVCQEGMEEDTRDLAIFVPGEIRGGPGETRAERERGGEKETGKWMR